ncbi:MAG: prepilin-type N-terminal cleavage/methylation domain-containing protein [Candidatus Gribaldobacteria bacterium]|nr:prepilin-type N-terminal cleavage/methylation domain-containing protein [Candidatus Gribaldobacteria bacterium]
MLKIKKNHQGFTLVEIVVGMALVILVFLGIYGALVAVLRTVGQTTAEAIAITLANQKMEEVRNLAYNQVGTSGGIPSGSIAQQENVERNKISFNIRTTIIYIDDPFDGVAPVDTLPIDYKRVKIQVSWPSWMGGEFLLISDVAPKGIENTQGGGTLKIKVFDASGNGVSQADVHLVNLRVTPNIDATYKTDNTGGLVLAGAPTSTEGYQITVSKGGFSQERTYGSLEMANPVKPHSSVFEAQVTEISFAIDKVAFFSVATHAREGFDDDFNTAGKIASSTDIVVSGGEVKLDKISGVYKDIGVLESNSINPAGLLNWDRVYFLDSQAPNTLIRYQVLFATGSGYQLVPDSDLANNSAGYTVSPINLASLDIDLYTNLKLRATLTTSDSAFSPIILAWHLIYNTPLIDNINFHLKGSKILGTDTVGNNIYKYSQSLNSNSSGQATVSNLEWDSYLFLSTTTTGMNLTEILPSSPSVNLLPEQNQAIVLYFQAQNTLLVKVKDASSSSWIFGASVRLINNPLGYDVSELSSSKGEAFFTPLANSSYQLQISALGYQATSTSINVNGNTVKNISLVAE